MRSRVIKEAIILGLLGLLAYAAVEAIQAILGVGPFGRAIALLQNPEHLSEAGAASEEFFAMGAAHGALNVWVLHPLILASLAILYAQREKSVLGLPIIALPLALAGSFLAFPLVLYLLLGYSGWTWVVWWLSRSLWVKYSVPTNV